MSPKEITAAPGRDGGSIRVMLMRLAEARVLHKTDYGKYSVTPVTVSYVTDETVAFGLLTTANVSHSLIKRKIYYNHKGGVEAEPTDPSMCYRCYRCYRGIYSRGRAIGIANG